MMAKELISRDCYGRPIPIDTAILLRDLWALPTELISQAWEWVSEQRRLEWEYSLPQDVHYIENPPPKVQEPLRSAVRLLLRTMPEDWHERRLLETNQLN